MPSITIYVSKDLYGQIQKAEDGESKTIQKALEAWFKKTGIE